MSIDRVRGSGGQNAMARLERCNDKTFRSNFKHRRLPGIGRPFASSRSETAERRMIQRRQTLYLLLAVVLLGLSFIVPYATYERLPDGPGWAFEPLGLMRDDGTPMADVGYRVPFHLLTGLAGALLLVSVFLFGNRPRQARLVRMGWLMLAGLCVGVLVTFFSVQAYLEQGGKLASQVGPGALLLPVALVLAFLAERAIRKDEDLVRSVDRIR